MSDAGAQTRQGPTSDIDGCRNGPSGVGPCDAAGGNLGWVNQVSAPHALYRMGDFVPFRLVLRRLLPGREYTIRISYTALKGTWHGFDYLGTYNASEQPRGLLAQNSVVPCGSINETVGDHSCASGNPDTQAIPPDLHTTFPTNTQAAHPPGTHPPLSGTQHFTLWGGSFNAVSNYFYDCATCTPITSATRADTERQINVRFTTPSGSCPGNGPIDNSCTVILAWSGHIASARDWGFGRTYAEMGGGTAGFHMKAIHAVVDGITYELGGEIPVSVTAMARPVLTTQVSFTRNPTPNSPPTAVVGQEVTDTATIAARTVDNTVQAPWGDVRFFVCGPAPLPDPAVTGGCPPFTGRDLGSNLVLHQGALYQASQVFTPEAPGRYCFRAEFTPTSPYYSQRHHTNNVTVPTLGAECFNVVAGRLMVSKFCNTEGDDGHWNLLVDGNPWGGTAGEGVACGGSTGFIDVATIAAPKTISESPAGITNPANYEQPPTFDGDCTDNGNGTATATLTATAPGNVQICTITNRRLTAPANAFLTLHKVCDPTGDNGQFEILVDNGGSAVLGCGQSTAEPLAVEPGVAHTVSEVGVTSTTLANYTVAIACTGTGTASITLGPGQTGECTITNTRKPETEIPPPPATPGTLTVNKVCVPARAGGHFNLTINGTVAGTGGNVGCVGTTGAVEVTPGPHTVGETAANGNSLARYHVRISGDCAANGTVTVAAGQPATCLITNVLRTVLKPPPLCPTLHIVGRRMVKTGTGVRVVARVHLDGRPLQAVHVFAFGPGVTAVQRTGPTGHAVFFLNLRRPGILTLRILRAFGCPKPHPGRIGILGVSQPSLTG